MNTAGAKQGGLRRTSVRTQMILGTITILSLVLILFGLFVRYTVSTTLMLSVDHDLIERTNRMVRPGPPPPAARFLGGFDQNNGPANGQSFYAPGQGDGQNGPPPWQNGQGQSPQTQNGSDPGQNGPPQGDSGPDGFPPGENGQNYGGSPPGDGNGPNDGTPGQFDNPGGEDRQGNPPPVQFGQQQPSDNYRPRRFTITGQAEDNGDRRSAWSVDDIVTASKLRTPVFSTILYDGEQLRIITRYHPRRNGHSDFIQDAYPLARVDDAIAGVDKALIILIPVALIIAAIGGFLVTKSVFERLGQMVKSTSSIHATDLSQRLPVVGHDEFAELAETFNALLSRVETAFKEQTRIAEQLRRFTADASHELKTPLTVIRGTTSLALSGNGILDAQATSEIDAAAASMSDLVQDLIYLARSDSGQLGKERIQMLLLDPLQRAVSTVRSISPVAITLEVSDGSVVVDADESEITRLFTNILQNAAQHTLASGQITATIASNGQSAIVTIVDNGSGIASKHISRLFDRFYRIDSARSRDKGGTGLGLSICKGIVDAHGGKISIESQIGKGTRVTINLPRIVETG